MTAMGLLTVPRHYVDHSRAFSCPAFYSLKVDTTNINKQVLITPKRKSISIIDDDFAGEHSSGEEEEKISSR